MPTHFVAIKIDDESVLARFQEVIDSLIAKDKSLKHAAVSVEKSHITLLALDIKEDKLASVVAEFEKSVKNSIISEEAEATFDIAFRGHAVETISRGHKIVYANIVLEDAVKELILKTVKNLRLDLTKAGAKPERERKDLFFHTTLFNTAKLGSIPIPVPDSILEDISSKYSTNQKVASLHLLSMKKPVDSQGFYHCETEVKF